MDKSENLSLWKTFIFPFFMVYSFKKCYNIPIKSGAIGFYGGTVTVESTGACICAGKGGDSRGTENANPGGNGGNIESGAISFAYLMR